jgi:hypothetical protein
MTFANKSLEWSAPSLRRAKVPQKILAEVRAPGNRLHEATLRALSALIRAVSDHSGS